ASEWLDNARQWLWEFPKSFWDFPEVSPNFQNCRGKRSATRFLLIIYVTPSIWSSNPEKISRNLSSTLASAFQKPRPCASNNRPTSERAECGLRFFNLSSISSSSTKVLATSV